MSAREAFFQLGITRAPGYLVARQSSKMANAKAFSSSGSDSSESSSSSLTTSHRKSTTVVQQRRNSEAGNPRTLQSLVRTKCWSIAPLWKFVTYELETAPIKPREPKNPPEKLSRSASFRPKKQHQKQVKTFSTFLCLYNLFCFHSPSCFYHSVFAYLKAFGIGIGNLK